ncbi:MAG: fused MFS/spermidine synthase [Saprospiraceae bacterium]|nr:fused MFS/spermidine synthase [Saprospiraceae bacterium]
MKIPWYIKCLSYLNDIKFDERISEHSETLRVYLSNNRFKLVAGDAVYSEEDKYYNFLETFKNIKVKSKDFKDVLVLGLGLGSIPFMLERKFNLRYNYTVVEIDSEIISLFRKFVFNELSSGIDIINQDAQNFMLKNSKSFDLICVDLFINRFIPVQFLSSEFIKKLHSAMNPGAYLIWNTIEGNTKEENNQAEFFNSIFLNEFRNNSILKVVENKMYIGINSD